MKKLYSVLLVMACCVNLSFSQSYDLGITAIIDPLSGANVDQNYSDSIKFTMVNYGPDIPSTVILGMRMIVDGTPVLPGYLLQFTDTFPTSAGAVVSAEVDFGSLVPLLTPGTHKICFTIYMPGVDTNAANDTACADYIIMMSGIESILGMKSNIFLSNGQLNVDVTNPNIVGTTVLTVYNMAGTLIYTETIGGDGHVASTVNLTNHATGMYIVRLMSDGKLIESRKLMK